jgi:hypothetical protein
MSIILQSPRILSKVSLATDESSLGRCDGIACYRQLCALHEAPSVRMTIADPGLAAYCNTTWNLSRRLEPSLVTRIMQSGHVLARRPLIPPAAGAKQCSMAASCIRGGVMDR